MDLHHLPDVAVGIPFPCNELLSNPSGYSKKLVAPSGCSPLEPIGEVSIPL